LETNVPRIIWQTGTYISGAIITALAVDSYHRNVSEH